MNIAIDQASVRSSFPGSIRSSRRFRSYLGLVVLPSLLVLLYMVILANPQYVTEFRYSVYSLPTIANANEGLISSQQLNSSTHGNYIVDDYLRSRQAVEDLRKTINLPDIYRTGSFDPVFHFWWDDGSVERLTRYWRNLVIDAAFDQYTQLGRASVRAFTAKDSLRIAESLMAQAEKVVNDIGARPHVDAIRFAQAELAVADKRMEAAQQAVRAFRETRHTLTPAKPADTNEALAASLRQNLSTLGAQLDAVGPLLSPSAPAVLNLKAQSAATQKELDRISGTLGDGGMTEGGIKRALPSELTEFETLEQERLFAAQQREQAFRHLEQVKFDATVQHYYIEMHVRPSQAQSASYPQPLRLTAITFAVLTTLWMIGVLLYYSIREHVG